MFKKVVILVILFSMMLHCASRVGFLSFLYQQRHEIAYTIGLIAEVPIALCSSNHDPNPGLKIQALDESETTLPPSIYQAKEIQLFFDGSRIDVTPKLSVIQTNSFSEVIEIVYFSPTLSIFHPPS